MKSLCDLKENGGLQMPNLKTYFESVYMSWIQDWVSLENKKLLKLEGSGLNYGWHAYLIYDKDRIYRIFTCHIIRKALLNVWKNIKESTEIKKQDGLFLWKF